MGRMDPPLKDHNRTDRMWTTGAMIGDRYRTPSVLSPPSMLTFIRPTDMDHSIDLSRYRVRQFTKDVGKAFQKKSRVPGQGHFSGAQYISRSRVFRTVGQYLRRRSLASLFEQFQLFQFHDSLAFG